MKRIKIFLLLPALAVFAGTLCGCEGRKADNMQPVGETVRVVIPVSDVAADSAIAAGDADPLGDSAATL